MTEELKYKLEDLESLTKTLSRSLEGSGEKLDSRDVANIMNIIQEKLSEIIKDIK